MSWGLNSSSLMDRQLVWCLTQRNCLHFTFRIFVSLPTCIFQLFTSLHGRNNNLHLPRYSPVWHVVRCNVWLILLVLIRLRRGERGDLQYQVFEPNKDSDFAADGRNRQLEVVLATPLIRTVRALLLMKWMLLVVILEVNSLISTV